GLRCSGSRAAACVVTIWISREADGGERAFVVSLTCHCVTRWVVGTIDEIPPGSRKIVDIAGRSVGVFNVGGEYFALLNRCPHRGGPLCLGNTHGLLRSAAVGEYDYSRPGEMLRCPWHGWEYAMRTGQ